MTRSSLTILLAAALISSSLGACLDPHEDGPELYSQSDLLSDLSQHELQVLLEEAGRIYSTDVPLEELCMVNAVFWSEVPPMGGEGWTCPEWYEGCLRASTASPEEIPEAAVEDFADCHVTVEEYLTCVQDEVAMMRQLGQDSSCETGYPDYFDEDFARIESCEDLEDRCPGLGYGEES